MNNVMYPNSGTAIGSSLTIDQDAELVKLIKENNAFAASRMNEQNEINRRDLWITIYSKEFISSSRNHILSRTAADAALSAYDAKFTVVK